MVKNLPSEAFEDKVRKAFSVSDPTPDVIERIEVRFLAIADHPSKAIQQKTTWASISASSPRRPWVVATVILLFLLVVILLIGPQQVVAAFGRLVGYIPGVGIVDDSVPIRVLSEPVSLSRQGITVTVTSAVLTGDRTQIEVRIFGVPRDAYPDREDILGCSASEYLRLPDGRTFDRTDGFPPMPADMNEAVYVLPCIPNTLPGKAPEDWELHLSFIPAPADLTILPVVEISPSPAATEEIGATPLASREESVTFDQVIETNEGYLLTGRFQPDVAVGEWVQITDVQVRDASGGQIRYASPPDIQPPDVDGASGGFGFVYAFEDTGLTFPLTVVFSGAILYPTDQSPAVTFEFDAGENPQPGQEWILNQDLNLEGHHLTVISVTANSRPGFSFKFRSEPEVYGISVDIEGVQPVGGGGGGGFSSGTLSADLVFAEWPTGRLQVTVANLVVIGESRTWSGTWAPTTPRTDRPPTPTSEPSICVISGSLDELSPPPANLSVGLALTYEPLDASTWGLALRQLNSSVISIQVSDRTWGTLSPDGMEMAYPDTDGIHVVDLDQQTEHVFAGGQGGYNLSWSPDGETIAFVGERADGVYVIGLDDSPRRQVSDQAYTSIAGWSPDSSHLVIAIPFTGGSAWIVRQIDIATGKWIDLFTIENGTPKFLSPALSPDGQWLAYRGKDNSSLYLVRMDGSGMHLLMDGVGQVVWSRSGWMGITTLASSPDKLKSVLLQPEACQLYALPDLGGYLEGLYIP